MSEEQDAMLSSILDNISKDLSDKIGAESTSTEEQNKRMLERFCDYLRGQSKEMNKVDVNDLVESIRKEITPLYAEYQKANQLNKEYLSQIENIHLNRIESAFTRTLLMFSNIMQEHKEIDFSPYIQDLRKLVQPVEMKIYYYSKGDSIPDEDNSILQFDYQKTNDESLNEKVCSTDVIGFRMKCPEMKSSGKVTIFRYDPEYVETEGISKNEEPTVNSLSAIDEKNNQSKSETTSNDETLDIETLYNEITVDDFIKLHAILERFSPTAYAYFADIDTYEKITSKEILKQCEAYSTIFPNEKKGRMQKIIGDYYANLGENGKAKIWYRSAKKNGNNLRGVSQKYKW